MLNLLGNRRSRDCDGTTRRDFLKVGSLGMGGFALPQLLAARADAAVKKQSFKDTSVVWLWLSGGPTHVETFDPKMSAPAEFRSTTGEVSTNLPGVTLGGTFPRLGQVADKMAFVRSFAHKNSGHGGGTHWVMTGYDNKKSDNGGMANRPGLGAIAARHRGSNHPETGMPTYVRLNTIGADGPAFLGTAYSPFDPAGKARQDMNMDTKLERLEDRRELLGSLDRFRREADHTGMMDGLDKFSQQAFNLILGSATEAFDLKKENSKTVDRYGSGLGQQLLVARRLCEAGCGFVTLNFGGWDMHGNIEKSMLSKGPQVDKAVATFVEDLAQRGLSEKILLVISGEFGRTPRVNKNGGRDHWAPLSTLAFSGGGLKMGQVVGQSAPKLDIPATTPISPQDLMATVFHVLGIDQRYQVTNNQGRPMYLLEDGKPIRELV